MALIKSILLEVLNKGAIMFLKKHIKRSINKYRKICSSLDKIIDYFEKNKIEYAFVGGFINSIIEKKEPKDFDIIAEVTNKELKAMFKQLNVDFEINDFGSFKIKDKIYQIDVWSINNHYPFNFGFIEKSWKNIPKSAGLSIMGATYLPIKNKLYLGKVKKTLRNKCIEITDKCFLCRQIPNKHILIGKMFYNWWQNGYTLCPEAIDLFIDYFTEQHCAQYVDYSFYTTVKTERVEEVANYLEKHYNSKANWKFKIERIMFFPEEFIKVLLKNKKTDDWE
jgi:hypothetical protein